MHWSSQTPRRYKRNAITCDLHRAYMISDNFNEETNKIRERYAKAGFPYGFVNDTISNFRFSRFEKIIPGNLFDISDKPTLRVRLLFVKGMKTFHKPF